MAVLKQQPSAFSAVRSIVQKSHSSTATKAECEKKRVCLSRKTPTVWNPPRVSLPSATVLFREKEPKTFCADSFQQPSFEELATDRFLFREAKARAASWSIALPLDANSCELDPETCNPWFPRQTLRRKKSTSKQSSRRGAATLKTSAKCEENLSLTTNVKETHRLWTQNPD